MVVMDSVYHLDTRYLQRVLRWQSQGHKIDIIWAHTKLLSLFSILLSLLTLLLNFSSVANLIPIIPAGAGSDVSSVVAATICSALASLVAPAWTSMLPWALWIQLLFARTNFLLMIVHEQTWPVSFLAKHLQGTCFTRSSAFGVCQ